MFNHPPFTHTEYEIVVTTYYDQPLPFVGKIIDTDFLADATEDASNFLDEFKCSFSDASLFSLLVVNSSVVVILHSTAWKSLGEETNENVSACSPDGIGESNPLSVSHMLVLKFSIETFHIKRHQKWNH